MMIFNPNRIFARRGIDKPHRFLVQNGFGSKTASDLINIRKPLVRTEYLERLCLLLNCTPNDLYEWTPDQEASIAENHPLRALEKAEIPPQMSELIKDSPVEKLSEVQNMLRGLKNQG